MNLKAVAIDTLQFIVIAVAAIFLAAVLVAIFDEPGGSWPHFVTPQEHT